MGGDCIPKQAGLRAWGPLTYGPTQKEAESIKATLDWRFQKKKTLDWLAATVLGFSNEPMTGFSDTFQHN